MTIKRKISDWIHNTLTYIASSISLVFLVLIFGFVILTGFDTLDWQMLRSSYWSANYLVNLPETSEGEFVRPDSLDDSHYFSTTYGIAFQDAISNNGQAMILVSYIDDDSLFKAATDASAGANQGNILNVDIGVKVERIEYVAADGTTAFGGRVFADTASTLAAKLDASESINSMYFQTVGGGIWGSLITTLLLIGISILVAFPVGIFAAIYLNEIAVPSRITRIVEQSIEMLAGVPSIIFGLMGLVVFYPITAFFKIAGLSVVLGGLTMAVILLPVIIRSIQESLLVVPDDYRFASLSLGATQTQTIFKVILPSALPGILSALLLAISRIIGESAALIYTMGTFVNDSPGLTRQGTTLAVHIWSVMSDEQPNFELASAISIIILIIVLCLNIAVKILSSRLNRKLGI